MTVLKNASVSIGGTNLSAYVQSLNLTYESETVDDTAMGDVFRSAAGSLKHWNASIVFHQDIANVDANLYSLIGSTATCVFKQDSGSTSSTNPTYTGTGLITSYQLFGQSVGDQHTVTLNIEGASDLVRATS